MKRLATLLLAAAATIVTCQADQILVLDNGDELSGTFLKQEGDKIHFQSAILGVIEVPSTRAKVIPNPAEASSPDGEKPAPAVDRPPETAPPVKVVEAKKNEKQKPSNWKRRLEFGYTDQTGRKDRSDLAFRANLTWESGPTEFRATGRYLYGDNNNETSTDNLLASLRYRRTFSNNSFAQTSTRYERDPIKRINHDLEQSFGAGKNLIDNEKMQLSMGAGGAAIYRSTETNPSGWTYAIDAFQDFSYEINKWVSVVQDFSLLAKPLADSELSLRVNAALIGTITNSINMSMRYEYDYDNTLLADARKSERWVTSVAYVF